jgi:hypothetical protein
MMRERCTTPVVNACQVAQVRYLIHQWTYYDAVDIRRMASTIMYRNVQDLHSTRWRTIPQYRCQLAQDTVSHAFIRCIVLC